MVVCDAHGETFTRSHVCPICVTGDIVPIPEIDAGPDFSAMEAHEARFLALAEELEGEMRAAPHPRDKATLGAAALRARRSAAEITRWREDWIRSYRLQAEVRRLRA